MPRTVEWRRRSETHRSTSRWSPRPSRISRQPALLPVHGATRVRTGIAAALTILAALVVWVALVAPYEPKHLTLSGFLRIPLEGLVLIALAAVLPRTPRRILAVGCGLVLALVLVLKSSTTRCSRSTTGRTTRLETRVSWERDRDVAFLVGGTETKLIKVGAVVGTIVLAIVLTLAMLRLTRVAAEQPPLGAAGGRGARRRLGALLGARRPARLPYADRLHALRSLVVDEVNAVRADIHDRSVFAKQIDHDPEPTPPPTSC